MVDEQMRRHLRPFAKFGASLTIGVEHFAVGLGFELQPLRIEIREDHVGNIHRNHLAPLLEIEAAMAELEQVFEQLLLQLLRGAAGRHPLREVDLRLGRCGGLLLAALPHLLPTDEIRRFAAAAGLHHTLARHLLDEHPLVDIHQPGALLDVDRPLDRIGNLGDRLHHVADERRPFDGVVLRLLHQQLRLEGDEIDLVGLDVLLHLGGAVRTGERVGILGFGQQHDAHVHPLGQDHVDAADRGVDARRIAVVDDRDVLREAVQQTDLLGRERRARRRHDILHAGLVH